MPAPKLIALLDGGDLRSIGRADEAAEWVTRQPELFEDLVEACGSESRLVRMRAADAIEKLTRSAPELLRPYKRQFVRMLNDAETPEFRWHMAAIIPRLSLNPRERQRVVAVLKSYLLDKSSIVKTFAVHALADLAAAHPELRPDVITILREAARVGTPAMQARSRKLLKRFPNS